MDSTLLTPPPQQATLHAQPHKENFVTKYIFSTDHKMIAKQFLISSILWAVIGLFLSVVFRLQLGFSRVRTEVATTYIRRLDHGLR